jgi:succinyl-CoA synthetase alpha subunit
MAAAVNLTALAAQTEAALAVVWDDLGVSTDDRTTYINRIAEDVAALYHGRVAAQEQRRADTEAEIAGLQGTIDNMHHAMQEAATVVSGLG